MVPDPTSSRPALAATSYAPVITCTTTTTCTAAGAPTSYVHATTSTPATTTSSTANAAMTSATSIMRTACLTARRYTAARVEGGGYAAARWYGFRKGPGLLVSALLLVFIHRSAWKGNSPKFAKNVRS